MRSMINEAKLTKRYNTGDYEFEEYTLGAVVDEKESGAEVLTELKAQINNAFVGEAKPETKAEKKSAKTEKKEEKKNGKSTNSKTSTANNKASDDEDSSDEDSGDADESDSDDETTDGEDSDGDDNSSDDSEDGDDEDSGSTKDTKASKGKSAKSGQAEEGKSGKSKFKKKPQSYNRGIEQHKEIFSGVLRSVSPDWKKSDELKVKAKKASESLENEPFLDEAGEVLESFKAMVRNHMKVKSKK